jgi:hypothetical protein
MEYINKITKTSSPFSTRRTRSTTKVYKRVQVSNIKEKQLVDAQTKQMAKPPPMKIGS